MAVVDDLVTWLRAQIDEDERLAQAARHGASGRWVQPRADEGDARGAVEYGPGENDWPDWSSNGMVVYDESAPTAEQAAHIARHDPARVLREVEAKRRIIDECARTLEFEDYGYTLAEFVLKAVTLPYVDRPGYREEWRP